MFDNEKYLKAYFGTHSDYYLEKYKSYKSRDKFKFSIWVFLLGIFWFLYRKLWIEAFVIFLIFLIIDIIGIRIVESLSIDADIKWLIYFLSRNIAAIGLGFIGYFFYLKNAEHKVNVVLSNVSDEEERINILKKKGGVSWVPYIILFIIIAILIVWNALAK